MILRRFKSSFKNRLKAGLV